MRNAWTLFRVLTRADRPLALAWWTVLVLRGVLPPLFAVATGVVVAAVQHGGPLGPSLAAAGAVFILIQATVPPRGCMTS